MRLLLCFKASASAWPGWAGRPHECKRGPREHGSLRTIIADAIVSEVDRGEAAVPLQSLCQCLAGLGRKATWMQAGGRSRERGKVGKNPLSRLSRPTAVLQAGSPWAMVLIILLALLPNSLRRVQVRRDRTSSEQLFEARYNACPILLVLSGPNMLHETSS